MILQMTNSSEQCYRSILQQLQLTLPAKTESLQIIQYYEEQLLYVLIKSAETFEAVSSIHSVSSFESLIHWTIRVLNSDQLSFIMLLVMYYCCEELSIDGSDCSLYCMLDRGMIVFV